MKKKLDRQLVELDRKRVPLRKLFHGKEIREAAKALEDFRLTFNEEEMLLGAKLTLRMDAFGECVLYAHRPETDNEYKDRLEKARIAEEKRAELALRRKLYQEEKAKKDAERRKSQLAEHIKEMLRSNQMTIDEVKTFLDIS